MIKFTPFTFYDLQPALNLEITRFGTWPSHCASGCDRSNGSLMINMDKRNSEPCSPHCRVLWCYLASTSGNESETVQRISAADRRSCDTVDSLSRMIEYSG